MADEKRCLIIKDDQGHMYYLRPEVLDATRMPAEDVEKSKKLMAEQQGDTGGFLFTSVGRVSNLNVVGSFQVPTARAGVGKLNVGNVAGPGAGGLAGGLGKAASTVMCPW